MTEPGEGRPSRFSRWGFGHDPAARRPEIPALAAAVGVIASFWVWIAAVMGGYWERKAGPAAVAEMEQLSAKEGTA